MTRKRYKTFMIAFIIISISILSGFMINNFHSKKKGDSQSNQNTSITGGVSGGYTDDGFRDETGFAFYLNESAVKKTKMTTNEVTTFVLETKLFITNKSSSIQTIDPDAFSISYDTNGMGLLYSVEYGDIEKPIVLKGNETTSINFVIKYLIQDVKNFNDHEKHELKINYINEQILICLV